MRLETEKEHGRRNRRFNISDAANRDVRRKKKS